MAAVRNSQRVSKSLTKYSGSKCLGKSLNGLTALELFRSSPFNDVPLQNTKLSCRLCNTNNLEQRNEIIISSEYVTKRGELIYGIQVSSFVD